MSAADKLRQLRGKRTQAEVAKHIGVQQATYSLYESGKRVPSDENKKKIAEYYGVSVQEIFFSS